MSPAAFSTATSYCSHFGILQVNGISIHFLTPAKNTNYARDAPYFLSLIITIVHHIVGFINIFPTALIFIFPQFLPQFRH